MAYSELFGWWISSITFNIVFVIVASIYLHRKRRRGPGTQKTGIRQSVRDFTFVWILIGLLVLYVVSIGQGSYLLFATGNLLIESLLVIYVVKNGNSRGS